MILQWLQKRAWRKASSQAIFLTMKDAYGQYFAVDPVSKRVCDWLVAEKGGGLDGDVAVQVANCFLSQMRVPLHAPVEIFEWGRIVRVKFDQGESFDGPDPVRILGMPLIEDLADKAFDTAF